MLTFAHELNHFKDDSLILLSSGKPISCLTTFTQLMTK